MFNRILELVFHIRRSDVFIYVYKNHDDEKNDDDDDVISRNPLTLIRLPAARKLARAKE